MTTFCRRTLYPVPDGAALIGRLPGNLDRPLDMAGLAARTGLTEPLKVIAASDLALKVHKLIVHVPYPHYNDAKFVQSISEQAWPLSVGK